MPIFRFNDIEIKDPLVVEALLNLQQVLQELSNRIDDESGSAGSDTDAVHDNVSGEISAITEKASPVGADVVLIEDSADSNSKKFVQIVNLPTASESNDLSTAVTWVNVPIAYIPTGTTAVTVAFGNHLHTGVYEPVDATIVRTGDATYNATEWDLAYGWGDHGIVGYALTANAFTDHNHTGTYATVGHNHTGVYQPLATPLTQIAALANTNSNFIVGNGSAWVVESGATVRTSLGLGTGDNPDFNSVQIGSSDSTLGRASAAKLEVENHAILALESTGYESARVHFSTSAPTTEGSDGDIWLEYTV